MQLFMYRMVDRSGGNGTLKPPKNTQLHISLPYGAEESVNIWVPLIFGSQEENILCL